MYRYEHRTAPWQNYRRRALILIIIFLLVVTVIAGLYIEYNSGTTVISSSGAKTTTVTTTVSVQTFTEPVFTIQLPIDWRLISHTTGKYDSYSWQETTKYEDNRILNMYVDTIPTTAAVNRLQPVTADGNRLQVGVMSDDCITFVGPTKINAQSAMSLPNQVAKWQGINFICDLSNYDRNAVGTSSPQGINTVTLTGPTTGQHSFFFLYTDHNITPDYSIFANALASFRVR
ncbi:MAG: hypothetical protein ABSB12_02555 [Candidatus Saccharimonadales bacterium]|jgi:hypothetical protein